MKLVIPTIIKGLETRSLRSTIHEGLRHQLWTIGENNGFFPIAEYRVPLGNRNGKIDLCWARKDGSLSAAFEIDFHWKLRSQKKLECVNADKKIWVVVKHNRKKWNWPVDVPQEIEVKFLTFNR